MITSLYVLISFQIKTQGMAKINVIFISKDTMIKKAMILENLNKKFLSATDRRTESIYKHDARQVGKL